MFTPSRDQARRLFFDARRKYRAAEALSELEQLALQVITLHPEYHALLDDQDGNLDRDYTPDDGELNPFLHLALHLAVEEQLSIDQPRGIRAEFARIASAAGDEHDARHALLECLAETLWQASRSGSAPDENDYLECLRRRGAGTGVRN